MITLNPGIVLIAEIATVIGKECIGTLHSVNSLPFSRSNGLKTSTSLTQTPALKGSVNNAIGLRGQLLAHESLYDPITV